MFGDDHGDELANPFDGGGQGEALFGTLDPRPGIAEVELRDLDLPDLSMSVHDKEITRKERKRAILSFIILTRIHAPQRSVCQRVLSVSRLLSSRLCRPG